MSLVRAIGAAVLLSCGASAADVIAGEAKRGEQLFRTQQCIQCHSVNGQGGTAAPDLARRIDRSYNPAVMASVMWNHAPQMWAGMKAANLAQPQFSPEQAGDLFAYFVSAKYFERPGDAARGKQLFASKHCADCHGIADSRASGAPPVTKWQSLADPVVLVQQMWNHGAKMTAALAETKIARPALTPQELTDILVYLRNLPETRQVASEFSFPLSGSGAGIFQSKGCAECHIGKLALESRLHNETLTGIAAAMWDHQAAMRQAAMKQPPPQFSEEEMRQVIGYIWARQYFSGFGNAAHGKKVFEEKHCATCHNDPASGAPSLGKGRDGYSAIVMVSALWRHGPRMLEMMNQKNLGWPRFSPQQMSDLIAFLNSL
jgi:mono/diheme cytochrome c family protein